MNGASELEQALHTVETRLDETFEEAERQASYDDQAGAGLILEHVLDLIYDSFSAVIPYERVGVAIVEDDGEVVRSRWARSEADSITMGVGHAAPLGDEAVDEILSSGEALIVNDLEGYLEDHPDSLPTRDMVEEGMRSSMACPLAIAGKPIGMMVFSSGDKGVYTEDHEEAFSHIAAHVATILDRSRLYERLIDLNWQLRVARDAMEFQATHDGLTGLRNRPAILDVAERERDRARRQEKPLTIVIADVDHFRSVNDEHGHLAGDTVLQAVGQRLAGSLRSYETVGRYGGQQFMLTLYDCDADDAPHAMERLSAAVAAEPVSTSKGEVSVTVSFGAATSPDGDIALEELIHDADAALGEAKEAGPSRHVTRTVEADFP